MNQYLTKASPNSRLINWVTALMSLCSYIIYHFTLSILKTEFRIISISVLFPLSDWINHLTTDINQKTGSYPWFIPLLYPKVIQWILTILTMKSLESVYCSISLFNLTSIPVAKCHCFTRLLNGKRFRNNLQFGKNKTQKQRFNVRALMQKSANRHLAICSQVSFLKTWWHECLFLGSIK